MSGVITPFGVVSLAQAVPAMAALDAAARAAQALAKAELSGKLAGLLKVGAALTIPPLPGARAVAAAKVAAQIALNPTFSTPSLQLTANAALAGEIQAKLAMSLPDFGLGTAGIAAYQYRGDTGDFGAKLGEQLGNGLPGGTAKDQCFGVVLVATAPAAIAALAKTFF